MSTDNDNLGTKRDYHLIGEGHETIQWPGPLPRGRGGEPISIVMDPGGGMSATLDTKDDR